MTDETCQGWTNKETWNVALWINNDEGLKESIGEICNQDYIYDFQRDHAVKEYVESIADFDGKNPLSLNLISMSLDRVAWEEISEEQIKGS